jgi:hypothetical protein
MRLSIKQVEEVTARILDRLGAEGLMKIKVAPQVLAARVKEIIIAELKVEDDLNEEVKRLLESQPEELKKVDYQKMFELVKKRLAKERGVIL